MRNKGWVAVILLALGAASVTAQVNLRKTPYWASISAGEARMRTGPGRNYPASWLYERAGLPVKVVEVYPGWRKVRDPDGAEGWMIGNLISDQRMAMVNGSSVVVLRDAPNPGSKILWRAEPGVIGRVTHCGAGWCKIDVKGRGGFVETSHLWGVDASETFG